MAYTAHAAQAAGISPEAMKLEVQRAFKSRLRQEKRADMANM